MNRHKIADRIVIIFCIIFLTGRSIYLEYLNNSGFFGLCFSCGFLILSYVIGIWIKERKINNEK